MGEVSSAPGGVDVAAGHGAFFGDLVALDGHAAQVPRGARHLERRVHVLAHHHLAEHLRREQLPGSSPTQLQGFDKSACSALW